MAPRTESDSGSNAFAKAYSGVAEAVANVQTYFQAKRDTEARPIVYSKAGSIAEAYANAHVETDTDANYASDTATIETGSDAAARAQRTPFDAQRSLYEQQLEQQQQLEHKLKRQLLECIEHQWRVRECIKQLNIDCKQQTGSASVPECGGWVCYRRIGSSNCNHRECRELYQQYSC